MSGDLGKQLFGRFLPSILLAILRFSHHCKGAELTIPPDVRDGNIISWYGGEGSEPNQPGMMVDCPKGTFATGFQIKLQSFHGDYVHDNTGINGIRLYCASPGDPEEAEMTIESLTGEWGSWRADHVCDGVMVGYHVKASYNAAHAGFAYEDYIGAVSMTGICTNLENLMIEAEDVPEITDAQYRGAPLRCLKRQAICGIKTYLGNKRGVHGYGGKTDYLGLQRIDMKCCDLPDEAQSCTAKDSWKNVLRCDNSLNSDGDSSLDCKFTFKTGVTTGLEQSNTEYITTEQRKEAGISAGFEYSGLQANVEKNLQKSQKTGQEWTKQTSNTFSKETTTEAIFSIAPGNDAKLDQVVATCDSYVIRPNVLRRTDMKKTKLGSGTVPVSSTPADDVLEVTVSDYTEEALRDRLRYRELKSLDAY